MRSAILAVRGVVDTGAGLRPAIPAGWDFQIEDNGWITLWPLGRTASPNSFAHAWLAVRDSGDPTRGCWVILGPRVFLDFVEAGAVRSWRSLPLLRADGNAVAVSIRNQWQTNHGAVTCRVRMAGFLDDDAETNV